MPKRACQRVGNMLLRPAAAALLIVGILLAGATPVPADDADAAQTVVDKALVAVDHFTADPDMSWLRSNAKFARGMLIVPELVKAGLVLGGSGGRGVLLVKDRETGRWSNPVFYTLGSVSFGLQIGAKKSEVIMLVMSDKGIEALYSSSFKLGGEASVAAGPVGAGAEGATAHNLSADYLSFARSKGAFAGLSLEGAVVKINDDFNRAYYDQAARPVDIIVRGDVVNAGARDLRDAVTQLAKRP